MASMVASLIHTITTHTSDVMCVAFTHTHLATCGGDKTVRLWNVEDFSEEECSPLLGHTYYVQCCAFSPFGTILASCSTDGKLILWNIKTGVPTAVLQHPSQTCIRVCRFSPDSTRIVSGGDDNTICIWEVATHRLLGSLTGHEESVVACAFSSDSNYLVSGSINGDLRIWDAKFGHGKCLAFELDGHDLGVTCCEFSPTYGTAEKPESLVANFLLATCGKDDLVKMWEFTAKVGSATVLLKLRDTLPGHTDIVNSCCFNPKGDILASGSMDKTVRLWNPLKGTPIFTIQGHERFVLSVDFSLDGKLLASGSNDKTVMIWKLTDTSKIMAGLTGYEEPETSTSKAASKGINSTLEKWSVDDVCAWIVSLGLEKYTENFREHAIDGPELLTLSSEDLEKYLEIVALGHRNKILRSRDSILEQPLSPSFDSEAGTSNTHDEFLCPITREIMVDPVIAADGYTYDRHAIQAWFEKGKNLSPMTNAVLIHRNLTPNRTLKMLIQKFIEKNKPIGSCT